MDITYTVIYKNTSSESAGYQEWSGLSDASLTDDDIINAAGLNSNDIDIVSVNRQSLFSNDALNVNDEEETLERVDGEKVVSTPNEQQTTITERVSEVQDSVRAMYQAADERMYRFDEFFVNSDDDTLPIRIPFASAHITTVMANENWKLEKKAAELLVNNKLFSGLSIAKYLAMGTNNAPGETSGDTDDTTNQSVNNATTIIRNANDSDKVLVNDPTIFENDPLFYGTASLMNPYSITKLAGGIGDVNSTPKNYMYDIRDLRRFYGLNVTNDDILAVSNPTYELIINWSNHDPWGRTPYSWLDFVYCKYFGIIPSNRLITLRRYHAPTYDNLLFEGMAPESADDGSGQEQTASSASKYLIFSPHATVVSYFGGDSGNNLSSLMDFTTGINWDEVKSAVYDVQGDEGQSPQEVIDSLFDGDGKGGFGAATFKPINAIMQGVSEGASKVMSFGKFALGINGKIGYDNEALQTLYAAQNDPYTDVYKNRIIGPINRIDSVKKRKEGILFSQSFSIKFAYKSKAIGGAGGVNAKAAMLDILANCMEIVSPTAVFWGGGHRFMLSPHAYPYKDGGWRDSFMKKIYDGLILGPEGAISTVFNGAKRLGQKNGTGEATWDNLWSNLKDALGDAVSVLGSAILSVSNLLNLDSVSKFADNLVGLSSDPQAAKQKASNAKNNMISNLQLMWKNKMITKTIQPSIKGMASLLIGEPVGEWHLTVGNPLNPIMVVGNLICEKMDVKWDEELGPDDFPTGFEVTYSLQHGMARDKDAIQSMFNRGMGKIYNQPDYILLSSDRMTHVDKFTGDMSDGDTGTLRWMSADGYKRLFPEYRIGGKQVLRISDGQKPSNVGNPNTLLITKFTPVSYASTRLVGDNRQQDANINRAYSHVKSLLITRKSGS